MSNSDSLAPKASLAPNNRPHRRLSLLQSTQNLPDAASASVTGANAASAVEPIVAPTSDDANSADGSQAQPTSPATVRVMAYLSPEEARVLDETWLKLRSHA